MSKTFRVAVKDMLSSDTVIVNETPFRAMVLAPRDGQPVRVLAHTGSRAIRELPWYLRYSDGAWRYHTTGVRVHPWHEPIAWSNEPRSESVTIQCNLALERAYGSPFPPSYGNKRPRLSFDKRESRAVETEREKGGIIP